jgi:hypothetical protein
MQKIHYYVSKFVIFLLICTPTLLNATLSFNGLISPESGTTLIYADNPSELVALGSSEKANYEASELACTPPTITGTTPASRCGTGTVTLGATSSTGTINWYAAATGGTRLLFHPLQPIMLMQLTIAQQHQEQL